MSPDIFARDDWTKFTDYRGYEKTDQVIEWFWQCIRSWPAERKSRLLQFTTGTSRVPVNGFKDLQGSDGPRRFTIEKSGDPQGLPRSHTCFNRLDLPPYQDYESLESKLLFAIEYAVSFFSFLFANKAYFLLERRKVLDRNKHGHHCAAIFQIYINSSYFSQTIHVCASSTFSVSVIFTFFPFFRCSAVDLDVYMI